jgi:hypothetical protein
MAKVTNAFTTYGAKANREALSNAIYNIDPEDTPVMTAAGRRNVQNRTFDWQTESLPTRNPDNAQVEGFVNDNAAATPTVRVSNVAQISKRDATVSGSQEASDAAGKKSEMAHQMALASKALKLDMERIMCSDQAKVDGEDSTPTARKTRALESWISTNASHGATGSTNPTTGVVTAGTARDFTEEVLLDALEGGYNNGANPSLMVLPPGLKRTFSAFLGRTQSRVSVDTDQIVQAADYYLSDFGELKVVPSREVAPTTALCLDPEYLAVAFFRNFSTVPLAKTGDAETKMIIVEWGVECRNEKAHVKIADLQKPAPAAGADAPYTAPTSATVVLGGGSGKKAPGKPTDV